MSAADAEMGAVAESSLPGPAAAAPPIETRAFAPSSPADAAAEPVAPAAAPPAAAAGKPPLSGEALRVATTAAARRGTLAMNMTSVLSSSATLFRAAEFDDVGRLKQMLKRGNVDVNARDPAPGCKGRTALSAAVAGNAPHAVKLLLREGADPDLADEDGDRFGATRFRSPEVFNLEPGSLQLITRKSSIHHPEVFRSSLQICPPNYAR